MTARSASIAHDTIANRPTSPQALIRQPGSGPLSRQRRDLNSYELEALDPTARQACVAEKYRERRRNLRLLPFFVAGALPAAGTMIALVATVRYWWMLPTALTLLWSFAAKPVWFRWIEPWWERNWPGAAQLQLRPSIQVTAWRSLSTTNVRDSRDSHLGDDSQFEATRLSPMPNQCTGRCEHSCCTSGAV